MKRRYFAALALAASLPISAQAQAGYPSKNLTFIVPYAPGGLPDTVARIVAQKLGERLGKPVVVDNKPGGNGIVAYQALMSAQNDGHTFIVSDGSWMTITPLLNKAATYTVGHELIPVSLIARSPLFLVAHPKTGVRNLREFISKVKEKPGAYTYGSSGIGSSHHLTMEAMKSELNLSIVHIPFRGSGASVPALVGGQVDFLFSALPSMLGFMQSQQVHLVASNSGKRSAQVHDVETISEIVPGFDFSVVVGVVAKQGTSPDISKKVSDEISKIVKMSDVIQKFATAGIEGVGGSPQEYKQQIEAEVKAMARAGKAAELKAE